MAKDLLGWVANVCTGECLEEFVLGEEGAILLLATNAPATTLPGNLGMALDFPNDGIDVPQT